MHPQCAVRDIHIVNKFIEKSFFGIRKFQFLQMEGCIRTSQVIRVPSIPIEELYIGDIIGHGEYGEVRKGICRGLIVAIKRLTKVPSSSALSELIREAEIMAKASHPNIVLLSGVCFHQKGFYIVSEYLPGGNVAQAIHNPNRKLSLFTRILMARDAAQGMTWLHSLNPQIIHCDLKPTNLLLDAHNVVKVCDFGLSSFLMDGESISDFRIRGSPIWMAPEVMDCAPYNHKCDVYSFGIILWEICTRKVPYKEYTDINVFRYNICKHLIRPPLDQNSFPPILNELIVRCWAHDAEKRPNFDEILKIFDMVAIQVAIPVPLKNNWTYDEWSNYLIYYRDINLNDLNMLSPSKKNELHWSHALWLLLYTQGKSPPSVLYEIPWKSFATFYMKFVGYQVFDLSKCSPFHPDFSKNILHAKFLRFKSVLTNPSSIEDDNPKVTLEKWGKIVASFSNPRTTPKTFLDDVYLIVSELWFFGEINTKTSRDILQWQLATFMIRFSSSIVGSWTISFNDGNIVKHHRIIHITDGPYRLEGDQKEFTTLKELIIAKELDQNMYCPGSPYDIRSHCESAQPNHGYITE